MGICQTKSTKYENKDINYDEVPMLETLFKNVTKDARIVDIYDGDTFTAVVNIFEGDKQYVKVKTRTYGYDCPEMKPSTKNSDRDNEKKFAQLSKRIISDLILNKTVKLYCMGNDKYGRILCKVRLTLDNKEILLNDWMVENSYGYSYTGDRKPEINYYSDHYIVKLKNKDGTFCEKRCEPDFNKTF